MSTFVLVHGAFYGGYCWRRVARALRAAGHEVHTPTLTGLGERAHLLTRDVGLDTHIHDVLGVMACEDLSAVILVGHSYAGMVIGGVAERVPERIAHLVFLDAHIPEDGKSDMEVLGGDTEAVLAGIKGDGWVLPAISAEITGVEDAADLAWVTPKRGPHPIKAMIDPLAVNNPAAARLPRSYLACTRVDALIKVFGGNPNAKFAARARAEGWPIRDLATGHDAMISAPQLVTDALLAVAEGRPL